MSSVLSGSGTYGQYVPIKSDYSGTENQEWRDDCSQNQSIMNAESLVQHRSQTNRIMSAFLVVFCVLIGDMARGILFPTLWLFVKAHGGTHFFQGCAVSAFSAGRILSTPLFGHASEIIGYRYILITCNFIILLGCYSYSLSNSVWWIVTSQFIIGVGAGSLGVTRSYVAETTSTSNRTVFMAYLTAVQYAGFTITPVVGAYIAALGSSLNIDFGFLKLNKFSLPALFLGFSALLCSLLMFFLFTELHRENENETNVFEVDTNEQNPLCPDKIASDIEMRNSSGYISSSSSDGSKPGRQTETTKQTGPQQLRPVDVTKGVAFYDSYQKSNSGISGAKSSINNSSSSGGNGRKYQDSGNSTAQDIANDGQEQRQLSSQSSVARDDDNASSDARKQKCCGFAVVDVLAVAGCVYNMATKGTIGVFETLGLMYVTTHYHWSSTSAGIFFSCCGAVGVVFLLSFSLLLRCAEDVDLVLYGLLVMLASCVIFASLLSATLPLWEFYIGIVMMYSVGYPIGHTALLGVFSKLKKTGPQGRILGLFGSAGSLARILFPLLAGTLTEFFGDKVIFLVMAVILAISSVVFAMFKTTVRDVIA